MGSRTNLFSKMDIILDGLKKKLGSHLYLPTELRTVDGLVALIQYFKPMEHNSDTIAD